MDGVWVFGCLICEVREGYSQRSLGSEGILGSYECRRPEEIRGVRSRRFNDRLQKQELTRRYPIDRIEAKPRGLYAAISAAKTTSSASLGVLSKGDVQRIRCVF